MNLPMAWRIITRATITAKRSTETVKVSYFSSFFFFLSKCSRLMDDIKEIPRHRVAQHAIYILYIPFPFRIVMLRHSLFSLHFHLHSTPQLPGNSDNGPNHAVCLLPYNPPPPPMTLVGENGNSKIILHWYRGYIVYAGVACVNRIIESGKLYI